MPKLPIFNNGETVKTRAPELTKLNPNVRGVSIDTGALFGAVNLPTLDASGAIAQGRAGAAIGAAVSGAGEVMGKMALAQAHAVNVYKIGEANAAMLSSQAELEASLAKEPDETKWGELAANHYEETKKALLDRDLSPVAREEIESNHLRWSAGGLGQVKVASARQSFSKAGSTYHSNYLNAVAAKNIPLAQSLAKKMGEEGYVPKDRATAMELDAPEHVEGQVKKENADASKQQSKGIEEAILQDPWQAKADLEATDPNNDNRPTFAPDLDAGERMRHLHNAKVAINAKKSEAIETLQDNIVMGQVDDKRISELGPVVHLSPVEVKKLIEFRAEFIKSATSKEPMDTAAALKLSAEIEKFNPEGMPEEEALQRWVDLKQQADMVTARGGEEGRQTGGVFNQRLYQLHPLHDRRRPTAKLPDGVESDFNDLMKTYAPEHPTWASAMPADEKALLKGDALNKQNAKEAATLSEKEASKREFRKWIKQRSSLFQALQKEGADTPEIFLDLDGWIGQKMNGVRAARLVEDPAGASSILFPADPSIRAREILSR